jgi:hypothetical protein
MEHPPAARNLKGYGVGKLLAFQNKPVFPVYDFN